MQRQRQSFSGQAAANAIWNDGGAEFLLQGETRFPTAVSYASDNAQRSDAATVCSESGVDDDDDDDDDVSTTTTTTMPASSSSSSPTEVPPPPPCSMMQRHQTNGDTTYHNRPPPPQLPEEDPMVSSSGEDTTPNEVDGYNNNNNHDTEDADCESLDVEANSAGMRSIHSQEDLASLVSLQLDHHHHPEVSSSCHFQPIAARTTCGGRQSPGGTIYKGRGKRRYQGRYMHLPLKRFHHNTNTTTTTTAVAAEAAVLPTAPSF